MAPSDDVGKKISQPHQELKVGGGICAERDLTQEGSREQM